jgi:hypothetical protein
MFGSYSGMHCCVVLSACSLNLQSIHTSNVLAVLMGNPAVLLGMGAIT